MKKTTKIISLLLAMIIALSMAPISAFAQVDAPSNLRLVNSEFGKQLQWDYNSDYDSFNVYISTDGVNFSYCDTVSSQTSYYVPEEVKGLYYYYVTAVLYGCTDDEIDYEANLSGAPAKRESAPSNVISVPVYLTIQPYAYVDSYDDLTLSIKWDGYCSDLNIIDGYAVFQSVNNGEFTEIARVPGVQGAFDSYEYCVTVITSGEPATYRFVVVSYAVLNGITYCTPDFNDYFDYIVYMPAPVLTTKTKSEIIKWKKASDADSYKIYRGTSYGNAKLIATLGADKTAYTDKKVNNYKKDYFYYIACVKNGIEYSRSEYAYSSDGAARMRAAKRSKKKKSTVKVINTRTSKSTTAWVSTMSKRDRKTLSKFAKKHFKKGMTSIEKAQYTLEWINKNVKYAKGSSYGKIGGCSYVDAVFNKKLGQCLQYNGAYAMMLTYLGYEARIVQGWRGSSMKNKWSHYWCEVKVDGKWYLMETGNFSDSGSWMHFCQPYRNAGGYLINKKPAK